MLWQQLAFMGYTYTSLLDQIKFSGGTEINFTKPLQ